MTKKLNSRSIAVAEAIRDREPFETYGALHATRHMGYARPGRLSGPDLDAFNRDQGSFA
jgi:hypothetical protein